MPDNNTPRIDYLIVGQGLAGSLLAWSLLQKGKTVHIVDNKHQHSSSVVAAGLVNPVTGKRLLKADDTDACLKTALKRYEQLESVFEKIFYHSVGMMRLFTDQKQAEILEQRLDDSGYAEYLGEKISRLDDLGCFVNNDGGIYQKQTGYLDIPLLLSSLKIHFQQQGILKSRQLVYSDIKITEQGIYWNRLSANCCIFCEGYQATGNPWFEWLPFQLAKGEILTIKSYQTPDSHIINKGNWLIPINNSAFRAGSTNQWTFKNDQPTEAGRQQIERNLKQLFNQAPEYKVTDHQSGVRPATRDRKPFIGRHPELTQLAVFNGFGARGSMMIPYYADLFTRSLVDNFSLPSSVDIQRYFKS